MRVLEVSKSTGGLGTYMRWLAHGLDRSRFDLTFACLSDGAADLAAELGALPGVRALSWPMNRYKIDPLSDARVILRLARLLRTEPFDLVHAHGSKAGFIARVAALGSGVPVIYSPHNFAFHAGVPRWQAKLFAFVERLSAHWTARIITVSDGEQEMARQFGVGDADLFVTVHSGVDPSAFKVEVDCRQMRINLGVPPDAPLIGTVGRLSEQKAPLDFIRLCARLHQANPVVHMVWVGDGPLETSARQLANELGLQDVLHFLGQRSDVPSVLAALDVFVMTSHWEAFSLALLEAMAMGLPVVATDLPGIAEAVEDGASGYLAPVGAVDAMAGAVQTILADRGLATQMGARARQKIDKEFTRAQMIEKLSQVYTSVTGSKQQRIAQS